MQRTIIDVLSELGLTLELSSLKETKGVFFSRTPVLLNGQIFDGSGVDVTGSVFYKCFMSTINIDNAICIDCGLENLNVPKNIKDLCDDASISLEGVAFLGGNLQGANLQYAQLQFTDLQGANLQGANLLYSSLKGANLQGANLRSVNLRDGNLCGANLLGANLEDADLKRTFYSNTTRGLTQAQKSSMYRMF